MPGRPKGSVASHAAVVEEQRAKSRFVKATAGREIPRPTKPVHKPGGRVPPPPTLPPSPPPTEEIDGDSPIHIIEKQKIFEQMRKEKALADDRELMVAIKRGELTPTVQLLNFYDSFIVMATAMLNRMGTELQDELSITDNPGACRKVIDRYVDQVLNMLRRGITATPGDTPEDLDVVSGLTPAVEGGM